MFIQIISVKNNHFLSCKNIRCLRNTDQKFKYYMWITVAYFLECIIKNVDALEEPQSILNVKAGGTYNNCCVYSIKWTHDVGVVSLNP